MLKKNYEDCGDEELILRLRDGEESITDYIMDKYKNLVRSKAKSMYILGADRDDLIQEGMIGLFKAVRDYDAGRDASFFTFADVCFPADVYGDPGGGAAETYAVKYLYIVVCRFHRAGRGWPGWRMGADRKRKNAVRKKSGRIIDR